MKNIFSSWRKKSENFRIRKFSEIFPKSEKKIKKFRRLELFENRFSDFYENVQKIFEKKIGKLFLRDKNIFFIQIFFYDLDYVSRVPENYVERPRVTSERDTDGVWGAFSGFFMKIFTKIGAKSNFWGEKLYCNSKNQWTLAHFWDPLAATKTKKSQKWSNFSKIQSDNFLVTC